jgi:glycosyltransferase involved in cell wall biosynthesis
MKVALIFSGADPGASAPYRASPFLDGLAGEGFAPVVIDVEGPKSVRPRDENGSGRRCPLGELRAVLSAERPDAIQTFGWASELAPVWTSAARTGIPLVHFVSAGGPVEDDIGLGVAWTRIRPKLASLAGWRARLASRSVAGVVGSNRADIGQHIELGFFPRAAFSMLAPPPVETGRGANGEPTGSTPIFGVYDPELSPYVVDFLARAVGLTGRPESFSLRIAPAPLRARQVPETISFSDPRDLDAFIEAIDALVLPYCEDRMVPAVLAALKAGKIVIAPEGGVASELIEYGRHGVVYAAGSAYHLSMAINIVAQAWKNRPIDFEGVDAVVARSAPREVARIFAGAYRKLAA